MNALGQLQELIISMGVYRRCDFYKQEIGKVLYDKATEVSDELYKSLRDTGDADAGIISRAQASITDLNKKSSPISGVPPLSKFEVKDKPGINYEIPYEEDHTIKHLMLMQFYSLHYIKDGKSDTAVEISEDRGYVLHKVGTGKQIALKIYLNPNNWRSETTKYNKIPDLK